MKVLSAALLLLGLMATSTHSEMCPNLEEIYPCECKEHGFEDDIIVTCDSKIKNLEQLKEVLNSLLSKSNVELNFERINLGSMLSNVLKGIKVKKLNIFGCKLNSLTDSHDLPALSGLENTLEEIRISFSSSEDNILPKVQLGHMRKLEKLKLLFTNITELGDDWFEKGPFSLKHLSISRNNISKVGDKVFAELNNLQILDFEGNVCGSTLKRSMLPNRAYRLEALYLDNYCLTEISEDLFKGMPSLKFIYLNDNKIRRLEQRHWQQIWEQLLIIKLEGNPLECDSHMDWIFEMRTTATIHGKCAAPPEKKGLSLFKFIHKRDY